MKEDDYENKRMTLRETCYRTSLINENKRFNKKLEGFAMLTVEAEGAFQVKLEARRS